MSANHGSLKATKSCSSEKLSINTLLHGALGIRERSSATMFSTPFCLKSQGQILEEGGSNE